MPHPSATRISSLICVNGADEGACSSVYMRGDLRILIFGVSLAALVGLTKEQVLACMGTPASKATEGATEVWSYPSGNCTTNVTMMDGKVKRMNYVGPTGGLLSQNEQCFFAVANCTY